MAHLKGKAKTPRFILAIVWLVVAVIAIAGAWLLWPGDSGGLVLMRTAETVIKIPLLGENRLSEVEIDIDRYPHGWYYRFEGPSTARVRYSDGIQGSIAKDYGVKGGKIRFFGPVGETVIVRFTP